MELKKIFGEVLKEYRLKYKMSQEQLASLCDLDRTYISLLERGKRNATVEVLFSLCKSLNVEPSEFVSQIKERISEK